MDLEISFLLVRDFHAALLGAIEGLVGKSPTRTTDKYLFLAARHVFKCVDAYVILRTGNRNYSSKIMIRSCLEAMYRFEAVRRKPELLYRIAYSEHVEDMKLVRPLSALRDDSTHLNEIRKQWESSRPMFEKAFNADQLIDQEMTVYEIAREAGRENDYQTYYRFYCRFTHAGLRAIDQSLNDFDYLDDPGIALAILVTLEGLRAMGAAIENLKDLDRRLRELLASRDLMARA